MAEFSPLMLMVARESRRMSQTTLAKAAGVSQPALSQMEAGIFVPTDEVLSRLAEQLRYPVSLFSAALRFQQLPLTFFRKKARIGVRDVNAIRARVNLTRLRVEILLRGAEHQEARVALADSAKEGLSPEAAARRLRRYWNVPPGPIGSLTALVEAHGILVVPVDFGTAMVDGLSLYEPNDSVPPMIFLNPALSADRFRLTLAHELGHVVLHHHLSIPRETKDMEDEAFRFASEFLMPSVEIRNYLTHLDMYRLAALKKQWRVSMRALLKKAERLELIPERRARGLWVQLSRDGQSEMVEIQPEKPAALRSLVSRHLGELGFTPRTLSQVLHQHLDEFKSDFEIAAGHLRLAM